MAAGGGRAVRRRACQSEQRAIVERTDALENMEGIMASGWLAGLAGWADCAWREAGGLRQSVARGQERGGEDRR